MQRPVCHTTVGPPLSTQVCRTGLTIIERVIDFSIFDLGWLPLGQRSPKGETTYYPPRSTILQNFCPIAQAVYEICVTIVFFHFLAPWGLTPGPKFTKGEKTWWTPRSTNLQNFPALCPPTPEISVTKILRTKKTKKQTVTDISPTCLSACGDNNCLKQLVVIYENNCTVQQKQKFWIHYNRILSIQRISGKVPDFVGFGCGFGIRHILTFDFLTHFAQNCSTTQHIDLNSNRCHMVTKWPQMGFLTTSLWSLTSSSLCPSASNLWIWWTSYLRKSRWNKQLLYWWIAYSLQSLQSCDWQKVSWVVGNATINFQQILTVSRHSNMQ